MKSVTKALNGIEKAIIYLCMVALIAMIVIVFLEVISRYVFNYSPSWGQEVTISLMTWVGLLGMALGVKYEAHLRITFLVERLPKPLRKFFMLFDEAVLILFGVLLVVFGTMLCQESTGSVMSSTGLPGYTAYLMLPCTGVLIIIYACIHFMNILRNKKPNE